MNDECRKDITNLAKLAPIKGYILSGNYEVLKLKEGYGVDDADIVGMLTILLEKKDIRELIVNYDVVDGHILSYKFK